VAVFKEGVVMKSINVRFFCVTAAWALLCAVLLACGSSPVPATAQSAARTDAPDAAGMDLDAAIRAAAAQMGENLPGGTKAALVSVASSSAQLSEYVISRLEAALVSGKKLVVVDRANLDKIREEQGFQASGEVDDDSAKSIGKLLGAGAIVTGAFADLGDVYSLTLKAINIETATVAVSYPADIAKSTRIGTLLASGGAGSGRSNASSGTARAPATPVYKIGDTGPGGGIVFYDKGNTSGGWRYMEVSKDDMGTASWSGNPVKTGTAVGTGKQNTQLIAKSGGMSAMLCEAYRGEGFSDWFLPSKDELNLIYINLVRVSHIVDWEDTYWSSSQGDNGPTVYYAWSERFSDGYQDASTNYYFNNNSFVVRTVRQF
jgi:hypothetical protein